MAELSNNRRIAKNSVYLYLRMLITMVVSLYTSRIVLKTLGAEDFGLYNIIGGVIVLFAFLQNAMSNATQRYISYGIGAGDQERLAKTFSMSMNCHFIIALVLLVLSETVGLWFVINHLNIPEGQEHAAFWVYQLTVANFIVGIIRVPYNATIISYERMSFYAYMSVIEVFLKLGIVYLLLISPVDKLISYAFLMLLISIVCFVVYVIYGTWKFPICRYKYSWDKASFKELMGFSSWSMLSGGSVLVTQQGGNILMNIYRGVLANTAFGIANQVCQAIYGFVSNFQIAFQPQIVKLYASGKKDEQTELILRTSSFSYYLLLLICVPFFINTEQVMHLWLGTVPEYSVEFCRWMLIYCLIDAQQGPLWMAIYATGNIKSYTIWLSALLLINLPLSWVALYLGASPVWVFIIRAAVNLVTAIVRTIYVKSFIDFPFLKMVKSLLYKLIPTTICALGLSYFISTMMGGGLLPFIYTTAISLIITCIFVYFIGLYKDERTFVSNIIKKTILHIKVTE